MRDGPRRFTQDFSCPALLRCRLAVNFRISRTGLSPSAAALSSAFRYPSATGRRRSYNPARCVATPAVWALARSLATTGAIIVIFSSCGYWDVSVPRVRPASIEAVSGSLPTGFPIRTSAGRRAFAPHRGFSQLVTSFVASESHRHPPCALLCFPFSFLPHSALHGRNGASGQKAFA